jgi:nucleotide-binding universal stress UspA family protein
MFPDIMVPIATSGSALPALEAALAFSREHRAHLTVLRLVDLPYPAAGTWALGPSPDSVGMHDEQRAEAAKDVARIEEHLRRAGVSYDVSAIECSALPVEDVAVLHAVHTDLVVVGGSEGVITGRSLVVALLLKSGRPVLFVPVGVPPPLPPKRILLAWKPTREAARAMHDAMELLQAAERVDVVMVDMLDEVSGSGSISAQVLAHLERHHVRAEASHLESNGDSVGVVLQRHAEQVGAQLIVAGGYGHSRLREWVLGGATRDLLLLRGVPVLLSN